MPIYEYRCMGCDNVFSHLFKRLPPAGEGRSCPACGDGRTLRLLSLFASGGNTEPRPGNTAWPTSWNDTNGADPETLRYWRKRIESEAQ